MAYTLWSQDIFSKGELSPFMYARCTVNEYNNGLKTAQNVLTYPTGAAGKRFGTLYQSTVSNIPDSISYYFQTFQYLNECVYQLVFSPSNIDIYLEGIHVANLNPIFFTAYQVYNMITTVLSARFRCTFSQAKPYDLTRQDNGAHAITSHTSTTFSTTLATFQANTVLPVQFASGSNLIQTSPQVITGITYFVAAISTTTALIFSNSADAKDYLITGNLAKAYAITGAGSGTPTVDVLNSWTFAPVVFKNLPIYDFNGSVTPYDAITFTPSAASGISVTVTLSAPYAPLIAATYVKGAFIGGGGSGRITAVADTSHFTMSVETPFDTADGTPGGTPVVIQGSLAFLAEPAWSDARGWPQVSSSYQNRALFANSPSLPNGFWASVINDYTDFGDLTTDDDDAISFYTTSDNMNYIRFIVPYRSITVHTNTGIYSSPLSDIVAITPNNFTLQLQDSTPADVLQPQAIDNQILVLSGDDAHQMLWDGINNAYTSNVVSVINEQTIRSPIDETPYVDLHRAGSRFVFIINTDGSMAAFQTLLSQNVQGFTPQIMDQSYGFAKFSQAASSSDGRCWFIAEREIASALSGINITGFTSGVLTAVASNFNTTSPTAITFTTTGTLPASTPALTTTNYFWAIGSDADHFFVYTSQEDAIAGLNGVIFTSAGTSSKVVPWPLTTIFTLEELTKKTFLDCAVQYSGSPVSTVTTGTLFNAQDVKMVGDGFGFDSDAENNVGNQIVFNAHGVPVTVSNAYIGFPIFTPPKTVALKVLKRLSVSLLFSPPLI